ncbi:MAG: type II secretion system GspH family protein [Patescibacteria group bacterium]|nr:type II secretion system GspH family protein [Patescibacteria group bacterium]
MKPNSGFTLIELIIVMALIAIIATVTFPNFFPTKFKYALSKDAEGMVYNIRNAMANSQSQLYGYRWGIHIGGNASTSYYFYQLWYGTSTFAYGIPYSYESLDSQITVAGLPLGSSRDICFAAVSGLPVDCSSGANTSTTITLSTPINLQQTITVNSNGSVSY